MSFKRSIDRCAISVAKIARPAAIISWPLEVLFMVFIVPIPLLY